MPVASNTFQNWSPAGLVNAISRGMKSLNAPVVPEYKKSSSENWVEISPYGFLSGNYMKYVSGNLQDCSFIDVGNGSRVIKFKDSTMLVETASGHLVELDKRRRVVLVRVTKSEAEGAKLTLGYTDLTDCFKATVDKNGNPVVVMPGNIVISEDENRISVRLPDGVEVTAKKAA